MRLYHHFVRVALGCISVGLTASVYALEPDPAPQWSGFYIGGQLGGAWSDTDWRYTNPNWFNTLGPLLVIRDFHMGGHGFVGGGQVGFDYQTGPWVLGIEGSAAGAGLRDSIRSPFFPTLDSYTQEINWLATVTGRVGYGFGRWLAYGRAGWAGADIDLTLFDRVTPVRASDSAWANGWTAGGGAEYSFRGGFSVAVEYGYIDLDTGNWTLRCPSCPSGVGGGVPAVSGDLVVQSLTARLNYRFGK